MTPYRPIALSTPIHSAVLTTTRFTNVTLFVHCRRQPYSENIPNDTIYESLEYGSVYVHRVVALVGIIPTLRLSICLVDLPNLDKLMSRCRVKMTQIDILSF